MNAWPRNILVAMDYAAGLTFVEIGEKYNLSHQRAYQIWNMVMSQYGIAAKEAKAVTAADLGAIIRSQSNQRQYQYLEPFECETPEAHYYEVTKERDQDEEAFWQRRRDAGYQTH